MRPRRRRYGLAFQKALKVAWEAAGYICSERLQPYLPEVVPLLKRHGQLEVDAATESLLGSASVSTIERNLAQNTARFFRSVSSPGGYSFLAARPKGCTSRRLTSRLGESQEHRADPTSIFEGRSAVLARASRVCPGKPLVSSFPSSDDSKKTPGVGQSRLSQHSALFPNQMGVATLGRRRSSIGSSPERSETGVIGDAQSGDIAVID